MVFKHIIFVATVFGIVWVTTVNATSADVGTIADYDPNPQCPAGSTTVLPDPSDCKQYFKCNDGDRSTVVCPGELFYNVEEQACDYPENVDCDGRSTPVAPFTTTTSTGAPTTSSESTTTSPGYTTKTPTVTTTTPSGHDHPCKNKADGTFTGDPNDCTIFYECVDGTGEARHCPANLYWCEKELDCNWKGADGCTCYSKN